MNTVERRGDAFLRNTDWDWSAIPEVNKKRLCDRHLSLTERRQAHPIMHRHHSCATQRSADEDGQPQERYSFRAKATAMGCIISSVLNLR